MADHQTFSSYDTSLYQWAGIGLGTYDAAASSSTKLVFDNPDGSETWLVGTGLVRNLGSLFWTTLSSVEHRTSGGALIESITNFSATIANNNTTGSSDFFRFVLSGNDTLIGHAGVDLLHGHSGTNTWTGSGGADTLYGGDGLDTFTFNSASHFVAGLIIGGGAWNDGGLVDTLQLNFSGALDLTAVGIGLDAIQFMTGGLTVSVTAQGSATDWRGGGNAGETHGWIGSAGVDTLIFSQAVSSNLSSGAWFFTNWTEGVDVVTISAFDGGNDVVIGTIVSDTLNGLGGGDGLYGLAGNDTLNGGEGDDGLIGGLGNDELNGGNGNDIAYYNLISENAQTSHAITATLNTGGNGTVTGGASIGSDTLTSIEQIYGTDFADTFNANDPANNSFVGNGGSDTINYTTQTAAVNVALSNGAWSVTGTGVGSDQVNSFEIINTGSGNDTFTFNQLSTVTLNGNGGTDTVVIPNVNGIDATTINLLTGIATAVGFPSATVTLQNIENATGGSLGDSITGNTLANVLIGVDGDDTLVGGDGNDTLVGGVGADSLDGGANTDTADYAASNAGVTLNLSGGAASGGHAQGDVLVAIENVIGSGHADVLFGSIAANALTGAGGNDNMLGFDGSDTLVGGDGNDTLGGGVGADSLDGGNDVDTAGYAASNAAVTINLAAGTGVGGHAQGDVLIAMENVIGSAHGDTIFGSIAVNVLDGFGGNDNLLGFEGNDTLVGGEGNDTLGGGVGADSLNGGNGIDTAGYAASNAAVTINLAAGTGVGGHAQGDVLVAIENVIGSAHGDTILGSTAVNVIDGFGGHDNLLGFDGNDTLIGGEGNDTLGGGVGGDSLNGGNGSDTAGYAASNAAVTVNLAAGTGVGGHAQGDTLVAIENVIGSAHADTILGSSAANVIDGFGGNDTITGGAGNDTLIGGAGEDVFVFAAGFGNDRVDGFDADLAGGQDLIDLTAFGITSATFAARVAVAASGVADTLVTVDGNAGQTILLAGLASPATVTVDDFRLAV